MGVIWWTDPEREILKNLYPFEDKKIIIRKLKNKTWYACKKEAERLGIKRTAPKGGRPRKHPRRVLPKKRLEELARNKKLTVSDIAQRLNADPETVREYLGKYGIF